MSDYNINDLRHDIAETIRSLRDKENPLDVAKAKAVAELAQVMINSAKVEVDMIRAVGRGRIQPTGFINLEARDTLDDQDGQGEPKPALTHEKPEAERTRPHIRNPMGNGPLGRL